MGKPTAYPSEIIAEIRDKHRCGAKINDLAKEYYICRNTVKNYCKGVRKQKGA